MQILKNPMLKQEVDEANMCIYDIAYAYLDNKWHSDNARAAYSRIYYVTGGEGKIVCNGKTILLVPGTICIIPSGLIYSYSCDCYLEKLYAHFALLRHGYIDLFTQINECIVLKDKHEEIANIIDSWKKGNLEDALNVKRLILNDVYCAIKHSGISFGKIKECSPLMKRALELIDKNLNVQLSINKLANLLFISPSSLQKRFKSEIGIPVGKYISDRIMFFAEQELRLQQKSLREISEKFGFCDQFYFSRAFTSCYGIPPAKYRASLLLP